MMLLPRKFARLSCRKKLKKDTSQLASHAQVWFRVPSLEKLWLCVVLIISNVASQESVCDFGARD